MINKSKIKMRLKKIPNNSQTTKIIMLKKMSRKIARLLVITIFAFANHNLLAQQSLTLDDAIKIGVKNNSDLKQARLDIKKAEATVSEVFGNALPTLDFSANFAHAIKKQIVPIDFEAMLATAVYGVLFHENLLEYDQSKFPTGSNFTSMQLDNTFQAQLQLTQILFNSAVFTGIGISKDYLQVSKAQHNAKVADVVMNIKNAFYAVLYTKEMLNIINVSFENAQANLNNVTALSNQGMVSEFTLLDAQVRVENIKPTIRQLENAVVSATDGLKILLNIPQTESVEVVGNIAYTEENLQDANRFINQARNNNLNISTLEKAITLTKATVDVSRSDYYPTIAAFANYGYNAMSNTFSNWNSYPTSMIGLSFSMNLFRGLQTKYQVQQSKIEVIKAEEQIAFLKDAVAMQVRTNVNELIRIKADIEAQQRNVNIAERAYYLATVRFREGTGNQLEILNSDVALRQAKTNLLESEYNYVISKSRLDNLLGTISNDWLQ